MQEIVDAFELFDQDATGYIEAREFKLAARALGVEASREELRLMLDSVGTEEDGTLSLDDFVRIVSNRIPARDSEAEVAKVYAKFIIKNLQPYQLRTDFLLSPRFSQCLTRRAAARFRCRI